MVGDGIESWYPVGEIESILYFKIFKIFEISFHDKATKKLFIMNNGRRETSSFFTLKEFLVSQQKTKVKWF